MIVSKQKRGRPRTSPLSRREQLRYAQQRYRDRQRTSGRAAVQVYLPAHLIERVDRLCKIEDSDRGSLITRVLEQSLDYLLSKKHGEQAAYLPPLSVYGRHEAQERARLFVRARSQAWVSGFFHALLASYYPQTARKSRAVAELLGDEAVEGFVFAENLIRKTGRLPPSNQLEIIAHRMEAGKSTG